MTKRRSIVSIIMAALISVTAAIAVNAAEAPGQVGAQADSSAAVEAQAQDEVGASLAAPQLTSVTSVYGGLKVSWKSVSSAQLYRVFYKNKSGWRKLGDTAATSLTDTVVNSGKSYTYTVRCINSDGSYASAYDTNGMTGTYIAAPEATSLQNTTEGVKIKWNAVAGAQAYRVFYKSSKGWRMLEDTEKSEYLDTDVRSSGTYTYTLRCVDKEGNYTSGYNPDGWAKTFISAPKITKTESVYEGVKITWGSVKGAYGYRVFYKGKNGWGRVATTTETSAIDSAVRSGANYTYTVRCIDKNGNYISDYDSKGVTHQFIAAPQPSFNTTIDGIQIKWSAVSGAAKYRVFEKNGSSWKKLGDTASVSFTAPVNAANFDNRIFNRTFTVRCLDKNGSYISGYGSWTIRYVEETAIYYASSVDGGIMVAWGESEGASKYRVFRKNGSGWSAIGDTTSTTFTDKNVKAGTSYTYTVRCVSSDGKTYESGYVNSTWSVKYTVQPSEAEKNKQAKAIADKFAKTITGSTDLIKVKKAAKIVSIICQYCYYTTDDPDYKTPYGVYVKGVYTCAGSSEALGMLLESMGYTSWEHVNNHQWTHQWCELKLDGKASYADGMAGVAGYGSYNSIGTIDMSWRDLDKASITLLEQLYGKDFENYDDKGSTYYW